MSKSSDTQGYGAPAIGGGSGRSGAQLVGGEYLGWLLRNEIASARLYEAFAGALPKYAAFWRQLSIEERAHADVVTQLQEMMQKEEIGFQRPRFDLADIRQTVVWAETLAESTAADGIKMRTALDCALALERTMVEAKFFDVVREDDERLKMELEYLRLHTIGHIGKIREEAGRFKWRVRGWIVGHEEVEAPGVATTVSTRKSR